MRIESFYRHKQPFLIIVLSLFSLTFVWWYVGQERTVYYWDFAFYWGKFDWVSSAILKSPFDALRALKQSIAFGDYNDLAVWPLAPLRWMLGPGRCAFLCAVTLIYFVPAAWTLAKLSPASSKQVSAGCLALIALSVLLWSPLLMGFLDIGGLIAVNFALRGYWDSLLKKPQTKDLIAVGCALAFAALFRRWYLFWVESFLICIAGHALISAALTRTKGFESLYQSARRVLVIGCSFILFFCAISWPMPIKIFQTSYAFLLSPYRFEPLSSLIHRLGWFVIGTSIAGLLAGLLKRDWRSKTLFLAAQATLTFILFSQIQDFGPHHIYLLSQALVFFQLALWGFLNSIGLRAIYLILTVIHFILTFIPISLPAIDYLESRFSVSRRYPIRRSDLSELLRLRQLMMDAQSKEPGAIYVLASSATLNGDTLRLLERSLNLDQKISSTVLPTRSVDRTEGFPAHFFLARYVVVAEPIQYHLRASDQRTVGFFAESFLNGTGIAMAYEKLPFTFVLEEGVKVYVFIKKRYVAPAESAALKAKFQMGSPVAGIIGFQPPG